jgi:hypothetical protein
MLFWQVKPVYSTPRKSRAAQMKKPEEMWKVVYK